MNHSAFDFTPAANPAPRSRQALYLFAYDIGDDRRARQVRRCLQRWRVDGQLSVHETELLPYQARELAAELLDYLEPQDDYLLVSRLSQRGASPLYILSQSARALALAGRRPVARLPRELAAGWYLVAYDIIDPPRLQRVQRLTAKRCLALQRSVYLYQGNSRPLRRLLDQLLDEIKPGHDDLRLYCISGPGDLWFPSGPLPPLPGLHRPGGTLSLWQRLLAWLGRGG
jgi:CRISPR-associated endonuclease Cas2